MNWDHIFNLELRDRVWPCSAIACLFLGGAPTSIFDFFRSLRSPRLLRLPRLPRLSQISDCQKTRLYEHISRGSSI